VVVVECDLVQLEWVHAARRARRVRVLLVVALGIVVECEPSPCHQESKHHPSQSKSRVDALIIADFARQPAFLGY
jgi:hypothetical protein